MRYEHKGLGLSVDLPELSQRQLEAYFAGLREAEVDPAKLSSVEYMGAAAREAAKLGWLNGVGDVGELPPKHVRWLSGRISAHISEALPIPPE